MPKVPKLVNRGPAGLLNRVKLPSSVPSSREVPAGKVNDIAESLADLVVDIDRLQFDPDNARLHPDRNVEAITRSLQLYGQVKPIVVQRSRMRVVAGNGTMHCAKLLGWTKIAASMVDMDDVQAAGYGLADNRTAELAAWDFEVVARIEAMQRESGSGIVGWTAEEIAVLRREDVVMPPTDFPEVDEGIETQHQCPRCGYLFSGGKEVAMMDGGRGGDDQDHG
jgi:ParB-like nuclease domain